VCGIYFNKKSVAGILMAQFGRSPFLILVRPDNPTAIKLSGRKLFLIYLLNKVNFLFKDFLDFFLRKSAFFKK